MDKLKIHSPNFTQKNIRKLAELFPNCVTEAEDNPQITQMNADSKTEKEESENLFGEADQKNNLRKSAQSADKELDIGFRVHQQEAPS